MIPIFLSRPNPFTNEQEIFLNILVELLHKNDMKNITLEAKDYNPYESLTCLQEMIKRCYGMIIVSFGQSYIEKGIAKKGANSGTGFFEATENNINKSWITSPFCHIEGAIAFSNNLPILTIEQEHIKIEGILKKGDHSIKGPQFSLDSSDTISLYFSNEHFIDAFNLWIEKVKLFYAFIDNKTIL
jgi:hypothetical protein